MLAQVESAPLRINRCNMQRPHATVRNLVLVASERSGGPGCGESGGARPAIAGPNGLRCARIAASAVSKSAVWCRRRGARTG